MVVLQVIVLTIGVGIAFGAVLLLVAVLMERAIGLKWPTVRWSRRFRLSVGLGLIVVYTAVDVLPTVLITPWSLRYFGLNLIGMVGVFVPWWFSAKTTRSANGTEQTMP